MAYSSRRKSASSDSNSASRRASSSRGAQERATSRRAQTNNPRVSRTASGSADRRSRTSSSAQSRSASRSVRAGASARASVGDRAGVNSARSSSAASSARLSSVRIGDIGREQRAQAKAESKAKAQKRFIIVVSVVVAALLLVVAGFALSRSSLFAITGVEVKGSTHLTESDMNALAPIPEGTTLLSVDTAAIEKSIERNAWVEDARVSRSFPSTLVIDIDEREIGAVVEIATGDSNAVQAWAIATDGVWLMAIPDPNSEIGQAISPTIYEAAENALLITNVPYGLTPEMNTYCADSNV
ncbi:MAG: FtsQ-type POTRA domain-containing protein, partial [Eggerthellaceae bacterium]|nr:FtsQ-type POTRA domain-containing protein [Eggerthellaceae bacterium]